MMLNTKKNIHGLVAVALLFSAAPTIEAAERGFYFGLGAGQTSFDVDQAELDEVVLDAFASEGLSISNGSSDLDDSDTSFTGFAGYRFFDYLAVEAAYVDLGEFTYKASGLISDGIVAVAPGSLTEKGGAKGPAISVLGILPVSDKFEIYARGGALFADTELTVGLAIGNAGASESASENSVDSLVGVGAAVHFGANWSGRIEYTRFLDVGDEEETGEADVDLFNVSFVYRL